MYPREGVDPALAMLLCSTYRLFLEFIGIIEQITSVIINEWSSVYQLSWQARLIWVRVGPNTEASPRCQQTLDRRTRAPELKATAGSEAEQNLTNFITLTQASTVFAYLLIYRTKAF